MFMEQQIRSYKTLKNYIIVLMYVVFMSGNTILFATNGNKLFIFFSLLCECLLGSLLFVYILYKVNLKFQRGFILCFSLLVGNVLFTWFYNFDFSSFGYVYYIVVFSAGYLITEWMTYRDFFLIYDRVIYFLSIVSLFFTGLYYIAPTIITYFPITSNAHNIDFYNLLLWVTPTDFVYEFRNYGCFREPGVFQVYIILALMFHFSEHKINAKKFIVYSITLITTKSTTGYILYALLLSSYFFKKRIRLVKRIFLFVVFLGAGGGVVFYELNKSGYSVFQKFALTNISFMTRLSNIVVNYHIFLQSPLFGVGVTSQMDLHHLLPRQLFNINTGGVDTNTFLSFFATFGVVYGVLSLIGTYKMVALIAKNKIDKFLYFLIMFLALITENFRYSIFFYILFWYGINAHKISGYSYAVNKCKAGISEKALVRKDCRNAAKIEY